MIVLVLLLVLVLEGLYRERADLRETRTTTRTTGGTT
jgi:hypothetical protein